MPTRCVKIKLKQGTASQVSDWAAELNRRTDEVLDVLRAEGVKIEAAFLDHQADGDYLIYIMHAGDIEKAYAVSKVSQASIDAYHRDFKNNCWDSRSPLELLIDFTTDQT